MALSESSLQAFLSGKFGEVVPESLIRHLEADRVANDSEYIDAKLTWGQGVKDGESFVQIKIIVTTDVEEI